ncbi:MAG: glycosyltransferase family 4 protein [Kiritimatiellae bacterium]|nr:glycosyltransferase family 4 protein [Kiritimatiellia bacterium]MDD5521891.1 glycosyltransferase family 4 protein [Kiritimatiellia bacterium]
MISRSRPVVWYVAAGYKLSAGIEAYLCHYATEMRNQGFDTRIIVFYPLPLEKHRFLKLLEERGIPITSLYDETAIPAIFLSVLFVLPWFLYMLVLKRKLPGFGAFHCWMQNRYAVNHLATMIREESPDIIHVKGRLPTNAWVIFPSECTIYHHALMGTIDPSWTEKEVQDFRVFANRVARIFTPGKSVAETLAREYRIERPIDPLFTMVPDATEGGLSVNSIRLSKAVLETFTDNKERITNDNVSGKRLLRFGILCRFAEQKGISYILEALKIYKEKHGNVDFTFAGHGELEVMIREFVASNDLMNVKVVPVPSAVEVLKAMDVFVHPGLDDAMPVSIVEALMCGLPCISSKVGGTPDLVRDGIEGFLIEPRNSTQILECMERFAQMPIDEFSGFRRRARARYEEVCLPAIVGRQVAEHYRDILAVIK